MAAYLDKIGLSHFWDKINAKKQDTLVSGTNIKTINGESLIGSGNLVIGGGGTSDYDQLTNRPSINSVLLTGNKTFSDLGLVDYIYPVGSYYETSDTTFDPNVAWGGTWVLETAGKFHVSAGTGYTIGSTGGEATHTLTVDELPSHSHTLPKKSMVPYSSATFAKEPLYYAGNFEDIATNATGGGQAHNNLPPYVAVNRWHRTA